MSTNAYQLYKQQSILTASGPALVVYLFDRMLKAAKQLQTAFDHQDLSLIHTNCCKIQDILAHLTGTLDRSTPESTEISNQLEQLYTYYYNLCVEMNLEKQPTHLELIQLFLEEWREVWVKLSKTTARST